MSKIKGAAVVSTMEYIMYEKGKETYKRVLGHLSPRQQDVFRKRMDDSDWVELDDFIDFNLAIVEEVYNGNKAKLEKLGAESAEYGFNSILKFFIKFGSVSFLVNKATAAFSGYHQSGRMILSDKKKKSAEIVVVDLPDRDNVFALRIKGFIGRIIELVGKNVVELNLDISQNTEERKFTVFVKWE